MFAGIEARGLRTALAAKPKHFLALTMGGPTTRGVACEAFGKQTILAPSTKTNMGLFGFPRSNVTGSFGSDPLL